MIKHQLTMIYDKGVKNDLDLNTICFKTWKELHMHLFEHGLYREFQVYDDGMSVLHYSENCAGRLYKLEYDQSVPGSVLFEIVNRHASAQLN